MSQSLLRTITLVGATGAICGGFLWGRSLGAQSTNHPNSTLPQIISSNAKSLLNRSRLSFGDDDNVDPLTTMEQVLGKVEDDFVWGITNEARMSNGAIQSAYLSLNDPKTYFLDRTMRAARQDALTGTFHGMGAITILQRGKVDKYPTINLALVSVEPGSPAEKAGLKTGDKITYINDKWIVSYPTGYEIEKIQKIGGQDQVKLREMFKKAQDKFNNALTASRANSLLTTGEGKTYKLTVERAGTPTPLSVEVTTATTQVDPVQFKEAGNGIYQLRVRQFNQKSAVEVNSALNRIPATAKGLILDLRQNFGGVKSVALPDVDGYGAALKLIGRLTGGTTLKIEKKPKSPQSLPVASGGTKIVAPIIVLTDAGTSNLAEMVASALRETRKAKLVGAKTYGDPILQLYSVFDNGTAAEIATAKMLTMLGTDWKTGLIPDVLAGEDAPQRAIAILTKG
ncbi:MAG: PDZ domain-containing protein [Chthonomonadaceae bacterium]|nr:PDZ domain-containing protein [Chthonomonadaceae bacterium]